MHQLELESIGIAPNPRTIATLGGSRFFGIGTRVHTFFRFFGAPDSVGFGCGWLNVSFLPSIVA